VIPLSQKYLPVLGIWENRLVEEIPGSAHHEHDKKRESTGGNPPSGRKKPELSCLVLVTPPNKDSKAKAAGEKPNTENPSWNCACN